MLHETEDIEQERLRVARRPSPQGAPPVLCSFDVTLGVPADEFAARLRSVLDVALSLALSEDFESDLAVDAVPQWFATVCGPLLAQAPAFAVRGRERYLAVIQGGAWRLQEWLFEFDPESETRGWAWWDLTHSPGDGKVSSGTTPYGTARIWADTWGESFFACDELRWLAYVAGAEQVRGPHLTRIGSWSAATLR